MRKFERCSKFPQAKLPERKTECSAGYDFYVLDDMTLPPQRITLVPTGVKAYMEPDMYLDLRLRSGLSLKHLMLANGCGVVDADYADNEDNEGHIMFPVYNTSLRAYTFNKGDRIGQGIFTKYYTEEVESVKEEEKPTDAVPVEETPKKKTAGRKRTGGFGSTGS